MNYFAEMQEQYEDIVRMVCDQNDVICWHPYYPSLQHTTSYEFGVKDAARATDHSRILIIDWDGFKGTLYDLLYALKCYFKNEHLTKNNYDWSFIMNYFTKNDLKNGDVIKIRDGSIGIAIPDKNIIIFGTTGYNHLDEYNDDMTFVAKQEDIIAVRRPERPCQCTFGGYYADKGELVYERKEVEEMTLEEVCKALGKEIKIVKSKGE